MREPILRYATAVAAVIAALAVRYLLDPIFGTELPFLPFYVVVLLVAWFAGTGPALLTLAFGFVTASLFFVNFDPTGFTPVHTFIRSLFYFAGGFLFIFIIERQRKLQRRTEQHVEMLQQEMQRRETSTEALSAAQAHLAMMIENAQDYAIFSMDVQGNVTTWNSGSERMFGYEEKEIIGTSAEILFIPEDREAHVPEHEFQRATEVGFSQNERWHMRKDKGRFFASGMTRSMRSPAGALLGFIKVARDVTEQVIAEQERIDLLKREQEARAVAEAANRAKLQFVAMLAHELRNPLASIKGFASSLLADDVQFPPETQREFMQIIGQESDKLNDLIEQLLDISRLQAGALRVTTQPTSVEAIIDTAMTQIRTMTANHQFNLDVMPDLPMVNADRERTAQVIVNLAQNAAKFSPTGSKIKLHVQRNIAYVQFDVIDEGVGIPQEEREAVFEAFRQVGTSQQSNKGAGLGLAICKGLVEVQNGQIWIDNDKVLGTTISFTLPVADPSG
jgi:two-component system, chemotaxis family, CheB/CheR fusion protein